MRAWCAASSSASRSILSRRARLSLIAAKNFLLPKVDFVAMYRWLGMGNDLLPVPDGTGTDFTARQSDAFSSLTSGDFQEWQLGIQANVPLGFRRELAGVKHAELTLAQERTKLQEGELELSHQLAFAIREMEGNYVLSETNFNRRIAAKQEVDAVTTAYDEGTVTIDRVLDAQQRLAQAESDYFRSLVNYAKSISQVHFRKGSLLEYNGVYLAEGPWPGKAYFDARRRARARDASTYLDYGFTQPRVISRGPIEQHPGGGTMVEGSEPEVAPLPGPAPAHPELLPTPEPEPLRPSAMPIEPPAPRPAGESQASASGGAKQRGWRAVAATPSAPAGRTADSRAATDGWNAVQKTSYDEPRENPPTAAVDRSASGWKEVQR